MTIDHDDTAAHPLVPDPGRLFRIGHQIDALRDAIGTFLECGTELTAGDFATFKRQYDRLRDLVEAATVPAVADEMRSTVIAPVSDTVAELFAATSGLARWVDSVLASPTFDLAQHMSAMQAKGLRGGDGGDTSKGGQYL